MDERVDLETWPRRELFTFFGGVSNPYYMVTFRQDVTKLYHYVKAHQLSFYYTLIYCCTRALNRVEAFRYTIRGDAVYRLEERMPSFTDLKKGSEQFHIVTMPCRGTAEEFCKAARERSERQQKFGKRLTRAKLTSPSPMIRWFPTPLPGISSGRRRFCCWYPPPIPWQAPAPSPWKQ